MGWVQLATIIFTFALKILDLWNEKDKKDAEDKKKLLQEGLDALEKNDASALTRWLDRVR